MTVASHVGPRWLIGRRSEASVLLNALHHRAGSGMEAFAYRDVGLRVEGRHRITRRTTVHGRLSRHERRHDDHADRDGPITDVSVGTGWVASPTVRIDALLGWTSEPDGARALAQYAAVGPVWRDGGTAVGFHGGGLGHVHWSDFEGNWAPGCLAAGHAATGRGACVSTSTTEPSPWGLQPGGPRWCGSSGDSNAQLHDYKRTFGELSFVRLF